MSDDSIIIPQSRFVGCKHCGKTCGVMLYGEDGAEELECYNCLIRRSKALDILFKKREFVPYHPDENLPHKFRIHFVWSQEEDFVEAIEEWWRKKNENLNNTNKR